MAPLSSLWVTLCPPSLSLSVQVTRLRRSSWPCVAPLSSLWVTLCPPPPLSVQVTRLRRCSWPCVAPLSSLWVTLCPPSPPSLSVQVTRLRRSSWPCVAPLSSLWVTRCPLWAGGRVAITSWPRRAAGVSCSPGVRTVRTAACPCPSSPRSTSAWPAYRWGIQHTYSTQASIQAGTGVLTRIPAALDGCGPHWSLTRPRLASG